MHVLAYSIVHTQEPAPIPLGSKRAKISAAGDLTAAHARVGANSNDNADVDAGRSHHELKVSSDDDDSSESEWSTQDLLVGTGRIQATARVWKHTSRLHNRLTR